MGADYKNTVFEVFANLTKLNIESNDKLLPVPEIVIMGEQSSGKSSVVEGFVGERFNFVGEGIATKVPLVLSLLHEPNRERAKWELLDKGIWMEKPVDQIELYVRNINANLGNKISSDAIYLRVTRKKEQCLNIIDLPGLRSVGDPHLIASIEHLVRSYISRPQAIILCLDQATNDLANSKSLSFVQRSADPDLTRTIYVSNKFDNRIPIGAPTNTMTPQRNKKSTLPRFDSEIFRKTRQCTGIRRY